METRPGDPKQATRNRRRGVLVHVLLPRRWPPMNVTGLKCADLVDAMGRMHRHRCHILDLVSPTPGRILFGPVVTISYFPSCSAALDPEHYNFANLFYEAVGTTRPAR